MNDTMNGVTNSSTIKRQATRLLLLVALLAMCGLCALAGKPVKIKGQLLAANHDNAVGTVHIVCSSGTETYELTGSGHYVLRVPADEETLLRFELDGHITKEVKVKTKNVYATSRAKRKNKVLRFNVELMPENFGEEMAFESPVGEISFLNGSGLMRIERMYSLRSICDLKGRDGEGETSCR